MVRSYAASVCLLLVAALPIEAMAQGRLEISENARFQLVRLWNREMIALLEMENSPEAVECRRDTSSVPARACIQDAFGTVVRTFALRRRPDHRAAEIGVLRILATPKFGVTTSFIPAEGSESVPFALDLMQPDWGYDYANDVTLRGLDGNWVAISVPSGSGIGWFQREPDADVAPDQLFARHATVVVGSSRGLATGSIYVFGDRSVVLLELGTDSFVVREEQAADMYCVGGTPPALQPYEAERLSWRDAYDSEGRLMLLPKYMRGC